MTDDDVNVNLDHIRYLHSNAERYKDSIYARCNINLVLTAAQFTLVASTIAIFYTNMPSICQNKLAIPFLIAISICGLVGSIGVYFTFRAILPLGSLKSIKRIIFSNTQYDDSSKISPIFSSFNHIVNKEREEIIHNLSSASSVELQTDLINNYYNLCHIVETRYNILRTATFFTFISIILSIFTLTALIVMRIYVC